MKTALAALMTPLALAVATTCLMAASGLAIKRDELGGPDTSELRRARGHLGRAAGMAFLFYGLSGVAAAYAPFQSKVIVPHLHWTVRLFSFSILMMACSGIATLVVLRLDTGPDRLMGLYPVIAFSVRISNWILSIT